MSDDLKRVPYPEHPDRCQANAKGEQCLMFKAAVGNNCMMHGGNKAIEAEQTAGLKNYQLTMWRAKLERHSSSSAIKGLREEIGVLRMVLETRLNQCKSDSELMISSGAIADMVLKIEKLVSSCHRLEGSMGELLDKASILKFGHVMIDIISDVLAGDTEKMNLIANRMMAEIGKIGS